MALVESPPIFLLLFGSMLYLFAVVTNQLCPAPLGTPLLLVRHARMDAPEKGT